MEHDPPARLKTAALVQLVSGAINLVVVSWFVSTAVGGVCGVLTIFLGSIGACCGIFPLLLIPVGLLEVVSGILGLTNPQTAGRIMRITAYVELGSLLVGGLLAAVAGGFALASLNDPEVAGYIQG